MDPQTERMVTHAGLMGIRSVSGALLGALLGPLATISAVPAHAEKPAVPKDRAALKRASEKGDGRASFELAQNEEGPQARILYLRAVAAGYGPAVEPLLDRLFFFADGDGDPLESARILAFAVNRKLPTGATVEAYPELIQWCSGPDTAKLSQTVDAELKRWTSASPKRPFSDLIEAYANGEAGLKRDGKMALAIACRGVGVPAELASILHELRTTRDLHTLESPFRFCDHVTSGIHQGECAARLQAASKENEQQAIEAITRTWPSAEKATFEKLSRAAGRFFSARAGAEQDLSGTARAALEIDMTAAQEAEFRRDLKEFADAQIPSDLDLTSADRALNETYSRMMKTWQPPEGTTLSKDELRKVQRLWIAYRDAWITLGSIRYPKVPSAAWATWLTRQRIRQLEELLTVYRD